jgi:hypothetical protein
MKKCPTEASTEYTTACCLLLSIVEQRVTETEAKKRQSPPFIEKQLLVDTFTQ